MFSNCFMVQKYLLAELLRANIVSSRLACSDFSSAEAILNDAFERRPSLSSILHFLRHFPSAYDCLDYTYYDSITFLFTATSRLLCVLKIARATRQTRIVLFARAKPSCKDPRYATELLSGFVSLYLRMKYIVQIFMYST